VISPATALALCRLSFFGAATVLHGSGCFVAVLAPPPLAREIGGWQRAAGLLALMASFAWLPLEAAVIANGWTSALDRATLSTLIFHTSAGTAWLIRLGLSLLVLLARPHRGAARAVIAALLLASLALSGHAEMDEGTRRVLHILNHVVHLLSGGFWLGSLVVLPACLARLRDAALSAEAKITLRRFSSSGHVAVALVVVTGIVNTVFILGHWPDELASPYQLLLDAKIVLVIAMASLAVINRYVFVPRLRVEPERAVASIRKGTFVELALGGCSNAGRDLWPHGSRLTEASRTGQIKREAVTPHRLRLRLAIKSAVQTLLVGGLAAGAAYWLAHLFG
jgi:copper resistance protein D